MQCNQDATSEDKLANHLIAHRKPTFLNGLDGSWHELSRHPPEIIGQRRGEMKAHKHSQGPPRVLIHGCAAQTVGGGIADVMRWRFLTARCICDDS